METPRPAEDLPQIEVSRVSSLTSDRSAERDTARPKKPSYPRLNTEELRKFRQWSPRNKQNATWSHYLAGHKPEWHIKWDQDCFRNGRVLIIDYKSNDTVNTVSGKRHITVAAQEFQSLPELACSYEDTKRVHGAALRVIHVQNAKWATLFLLKKFNINHPDELVGMPGFSKWAQYEKPRQRNGKPFPNGRTWRRQIDPWRNVARTAFGMDYLKPFPTDDPKTRSQQTVFGDKPVDAKMMHLDAYEDSSHPFGHDVSVQRMSVYIQRNLGSLGRVSPEENVKNPYRRFMPNGKHSKEQHLDEHGCKSREKVVLESFDNSNTIIIFETSASMLLEDCLVQPRNDFENRWRRLSFYLRKEDVVNDSRLAAQCVNFILSDLFHGLAVIWDDFTAAGSDHTALLEDKIYENPADEFRAPELWQNQAAWLKVEKILWIHSDLVSEMQGHMQGLADSDDEEHGVEVNWLAGIPAEYERLSHNVQESLVQPTNNLSDLMYKSVGIRDSRQSLQLGLSMWRLSWITFIFLPLTFIVGFFGMNVSLFSSPEPGIGWYFVGAGVLMVFVLILWYCVKHSLQRRRQTPYQRGLYESLFNDLENQYPELWTSANGAAQDIEPVDLTARIKWRLIKIWFSPEKTVSKRLYSSLTGSEETTELGAWASAKRFLLVRWLPDIQSAHRLNDPIEMQETDQSQSLEYEHSIQTLGELAKYSTPVVLAEAEPTAVVPLSTFGLRPLTPNQRRVSGESTRSRPSSRGSSGIMIEERNLSDSESDTGEGALQRHNSVDRRASQ